MGTELRQGPRLKGTWYSKQTWVGSPCPFSAAMKALTFSFAFTALVSAHKFSLKRIHRRHHGLLGRASQSPDGQVVTSNPGTNFSLRCVHPVIIQQNMESLF